MDFLSDDGPEEFGLVWDKEAFEKGKAQLEEKEFLLIRGIKGSEKDGYLFKKISLILQVLRLPYS